MTSSFDFYGISFSYYGLMVGLAIYLAIFLIEKKIRKTSFSHKKDLVKSFDKQVFFIIFFGVIGARLWHVFTDIHLYANNFLAVFEVWNGGLSIFGGIFGGLLGAIISLRLQKKSISQFFLIADLAVFGLPFGQAVGRLGNYFNQELYGFPTDLPWGIFIDLENRLTGFESYPTFHPLFLYESIAMLCFGLLLWFYDRRVMAMSNSVLGKGHYFFSYLIFYGFLRFNLDFFRIGQNQVFLGLGINQIIIFSLFIFAFFAMMIKSIMSRKLINNKALVLAIIIFFMILSSFFFSTNKMFLGKNNLFLVENKRSVAKTLVSDLKKIPDRSMISVEIGNKKLNVEVVNTESSRSLGLSDRDEIGSDGMLFVFPQKSYQQFWMKDMKFNLDFIWIADGKVVEIMRDVPRPEMWQSLEVLPRFIPRRPVEMMMEVVAGDAERWGVSEGEEVRINYEI